MEESHPPSPPPPSMDRSHIPYSAIKHDRKGSVLAQQHFYFAVEQGCKDICILPPQIGFNPKARWMQEPVSAHLSSPLTKNV